jgi:hypothetical protein
MKALLPVITIALFCGNSAFAQSNDLDKKYRPKEGSSKDLSSNSIETPKQSANIKNALYFEPFLLSRGNAALTYEREISDIGISLVGTLGYNVFTDHLTLAFLKEDMFIAGSFETKASVLSSYDYFQKSSQEGGGLFLQASARIFLREYFGDLDGSGLELIYRRSSHSFLIPGNDANTDTYSYTYSKPQEDPVTYQSFVIAFRSQTVGKGSKPFIHGLSYGVGIRQVTFPTYTYADDTDQFGNYKQTINRSGNSFETTTGFTVLFNYSLGFGW